MKAGFAFRICRAARLVILALEIASLVLLDVLNHEWSQMWVGSRNSQHLLGCSLYFCDSSQIHFHNAGQPMLVPLTSSLYVNGSVTKPKEIMLDIGTGYFVQVIHQSLQQLPHLHF